MTRSFLLLMGLAVSSALAAPGAHGPNGEHLDAPGPTTTANGLARLPDGSVNVPMLAQRRLGIRTLVAVEREASATVELPARVVADPNASGRVQSVVGGKVMPGPRGLPFPGQSVRRGDVLAYVVHQVDPLALANQQSLLAEIRTGRQLAEQRVQRLESLEGTVPRKDIEAARAELAGLASRERSIGASLGAREPLVAPVSGVIAMADVASGQVVGSRELLFEVIDPARLMVEASAPDASLSTQLSKASLVGMPGWTLQFIGAGRVLRDAAVPLTFRATGAGAVPLAIGQPVTVLAALSSKVTGYVLPAEAITRNPSNEPVVWIKSGAERYIPQPVRVQSLDARTVVVTQGLGADNRVVVQGASLIAQIR
jgi:cobalt-zinc-cadmium efflux system membrane fusion protein